MSACNRLDLQTLGSQPIMPKISLIIGRDPLDAKTLCSLVFGSVKQPRNSHKRLKR